MDKYDDLAKRLRARVERSASRERSLDWKAADMIDHLLAECERLAVESKRLEAENRSLQRAAATAARRAAHQSMFLPAATLAVQPARPAGPTTVPLPPPPPMVGVAPPSAHAPAEPDADEPGSHAAPPVLPVRAIGLQEAADLLNLSYSTVFANRRALGFFQVGRLWRIWPETLREEMERRTKRPSVNPRIDPRRPAERIPPLRATGSVLARQRAAARELDALLAAAGPKRRKPGTAK